MLISQKKLAGILFLYLKLHFTEQWLLAWLCFVTSDICPKVQSINPR